MNWENELKEINNDIVSKTESVVLDFIELISIYMRNNNINQKQLAKILNMSNAAVSKLLSGNENLSIKRMVEISNKLQFNIAIVRNDESRINLSIDKENAEKLLENIINKAEITDIKEYLSFRIDYIVKNYYSFHINYNNSNEKKYNGLQSLELAS